MSLIERVSGVSRLSRREIRVWHASAARARFPLVASLLAASAACSSAKDTTHDVADTGLDEVVQSIDGGSTAEDGGATTDDGGSTVDDGGGDAGMEMSDAAPGEGGGSDHFRNLGFEDGTLGWTFSGDVAATYVESLSPHSGRRDLAFWGATDYAVNVEQTIDGLPAGSYTVRAWLKSSTTIGNSYLLWRSADGVEKTVSIPAGLSSALRLTIPDITVTGCPCTVGVHIEGPAQSSVALDDIELIAGAPQLDPAYLLGGDITYRRLLNERGVRFYDAAGAETEVLDLLQQKGFNFVRIRIYNDPGSPDHFPSRQLEAGFQDLPDALVNAQDAAARGMKLLVSFHYSDSWTNPGTQYKPYQWDGLALADLKSAVYAYTADAMRALEAQGTPPAIVTLGNETNGGMMWPEGRIGSGGENFAAFAQLFNAGQQAVKDVFPSAKVGVHLANPEQRPDQWLAWANASGLRYDVVGLTLYPFWSSMRIDAMKALVTQIATTYGKEVVAAETGFPWSLVRPSGYPTLISSNALSPQGTETFGVSPEGQGLYLRSFFQQMHEARGFIGALYWDPIWIDTPQLTSNVGDTALFDWNAKPLPGLDAFGEKFW